MTMKKLFTVKNPDGSIPDTEEIVRTEDWARGLMRFDIDGFYVDEYGYPVLLDDCNNVAVPPLGRFIVEWHK